MEEYGLTLTEEERRYFDEKGFLIVENALSSHEITALVTAVDELYERFGGEPETGQLEVRNCLAHHPSLLALVDHPKLLPLVVDLLGANIKIRSSHLDVRPPVRRDSVTNELGQDRWNEPEQWHVDGPLYGYPLVDSIIPRTEVKIGYYLTDVTEPHSGALCVVPGSHRLDYRMLALDNFRISDEAVYKVQVPVGSAIVFRNGLWHCVSSNISNRTRKVLYYSYTFRWIEPSDYIAQSEALLSRCTSIQRQLLGATASPERHPLGNQAEKTPCSFYWYPEPEDIPLLSWFEELRDSRRFTPILREEKTSLITKDSVTPGTVFACGSRQLQALCDAAGLTDRKDQVIGLFQDLSMLCKDRDLVLPPRWSGVGDDCTPFEFSIVFQKGQPTIRILVEAHADPASPQAYWNAGIKLNEWLVEHWQVDLSKFRQIENLFVPKGLSVYAAMGHAVDFCLEGPPLFKLYLNPLAQGIRRSDVVVSEALFRLGFSQVWPTLLRMRGPNDLFTHFSLDLSVGPEARVKVYIRHRDATLDEIEERCTTVDGTAQGEWSYFCRMITGNQDPLSLRPVYSSYHLTSEAPDRPQQAVLHLPVYPYAENDRVAYNRIRNVLAHYGLPEETYSRCVEVLAHGPLEQEQGLHSYVSYQCGTEQSRVAVYFGSRVYYPRYGWLALEPEHYWPSPVCT